MQCSKERIASTWFCNVHMCHLSVTLSVEFADATTDPIIDTSLSSSMCKVTVESQVGLMDVQGLIFSWKTVCIGNKTRINCTKVSHSEIQV